MQASLGVAMRSYIVLRLVQGSINAKTAEREQNIADNCEKALPSPPLGRLTQKHLEEGIGKLKTGFHRPKPNGKPGKKLAPRTVRQHVRLMKRTLAYLHHGGLLPIDLSTAFSASKLGAYVARSPSDEDVERLLALASERKAANGNLMFLITTLEVFGMRRGECLALQRSDFDWKERRVFIARSLMQTRGKLEVKPPKSEAGHRSVEVPEWYFDLLHDHLARIDAQWELLGADYRDQGLIFPDAFGNYLKPDTISGQIGEIKRKARWPKGVAGMHGLRHKFGTVLSESKEFSPVQIADAMGHADPSFTLRTYMLRKPKAPPTSHLFKRRDSTRPTRLDRNKPRL
jgi:integrase